MHQRIRLLHTLLLGSFCLHAPAPFATAEMADSALPQTAPLQRDRMISQNQAAPQQASVTATTGRNRPGMLFAPKSMEGLLADGENPEALRLPTQLLTFSF